MKPLFSGLIGGLVLTGFTMLFPYQYCMNGPARGFPFASRVPPCEATFAAWGDTSGNSAAPVLDLPRSLGDVAIWGGMVAFVHTRVSRGTRRRTSW
jgi:hypothetical protein